MTIHSFVTSLALGAGILSISSLAIADDADKAACVGLEEGDDCTRGDGDSGVCVPDDSDPVLTCEDTGYVAPGGDGSGDCSLAGGGSGAFGVVALGLGLAAALRRRAR